MRSRILATVFAATLGWNGLCGQTPAPSPVVGVDWPAFLAHQDLRWDHAPEKWENSAFIGNGNLGAVIFLRPDGGIGWEINRSDLIHAGSRYSMGHVSLRVAGGILTTGETRLDLWNAETTGSLSTAKGEIHWRSFASANPGVIVVEVTGLRGEPGVQILWLPTLARPASAGPKANGYPLEELQPPPRVVTTSGEVTSTQTFKDGGAHAVVLRRIASDPDRKVYVVAVNPGDTAARALSEASLAAERAASTGWDGLLTAHRTWWHQYYRTNFLSVPDAKLEAFYWIQVYKRGSALRADSPPVDPIGPWFRSFQPPPNGAPARVDGVAASADRHAQHGQGDQALADLHTFVEHRVQPNTFYTQGGPWLAAPLSAAAAERELLLQNRGGRIRVFPAMPAAWKEASFSGLLLDNGWSVSGVWHEGAVAWIKVEATNAGPCRLTVPGWTQAVVRATAKPDLVVAPGTNPGEFNFRLPKGAWVVLAPSADTPLSDVAAVPRPAGAQDNPFPPVQTAQ